MARPEPRQGAQQMYPLKLRRKNGNKLSLLKFHSETRYQDWRKIEMAREDNKQIHNAYLKEEKPEFGAGSVYRQKEREELRRARFETKRKEYRDEDQPWMLKVTSDSEKLFKGVKEGGVRDNSDYFIFSQAQDGSIEVIQVEDWYNFQAHSRFKAMDADEAEEEFNRRDRTLNYFSLQCKRKLKAEKEEHEAEEEFKTNKNNKASLKISELDEWISSDDDSSDGEKDDKDGDDDNGMKRKKGKNKTKGANKKRKHDKHKEAVEESDDGDEEGREREYISDSSDSEPEDTNLTSVAEEKGLKKLLTDLGGSSDSSDSSDEEKSDAEPDDKENEEPEKIEGKKTVKKEKKNSVFDEFSSSEDEGEAPAKKDDKGEAPAKKDDKPSIKIGKRKVNSKAEIRKDPKPAVEEDIKLKVLNTALTKINGKKSGLHLRSPGQPPVISVSQDQVSRSDIEHGTKKSNIASVIKVEDVQKYLLRKPITMKDLLLKFISKGFSREIVSAHVGDIVQKLQPERQWINGKHYFSLDR